MRNAHLRLDRPAGRNDSLLREPPRPPACEPVGVGITIDWVPAARPMSVGGPTGRPASGPCDDRPGSDSRAIDRPTTEPTPRLKPPTVAGYEILEEIGRGGMGVVYKARQLRLNRVVALKMILAGEYAGTDDVERFLAEAQIIARLRHPNVVRVHAIGDSDGRPYVELEYLEGGSLAARLDGTPWPRRAAARLVETVASALAEAHRMGIVHRDIKPSNILLTHDGRPKVTDFGLAKSSDRDLGLTRSNSILGSPTYMAPEQAEGRARDVGPAADIYALGVILYELLTGRPPFVGPSVLATLDLVRHAEPVAPRHLQPGISPDLETICLRCLRKEPGQRYDSADAMAEDLGRHLAGESILARPAPRWQGAWKAVRRRPSAAALIVVAALSMTTAVAAGFWRRAEPDHRREAVVQLIEDVRDEVERSIASRPTPRPPARSPDPFSEGRCRRSARTADRPARIEGRVGRHPGRRRRDVSPSVGYPASLRRPTTAGTLRR